MPLSDILLHSLDVRIPLGLPLDGSAHGEGDEVRGTLIDLTLAASGRGIHIDAVTGPGQPAVVTWLR